MWDKPAGGLHGYLVRFLESEDTTFQHIAVWTLIQLLESGNHELEQHIRDSPHVLDLIRQLQSRIGTFESEHEQADTSTAADTSGQDVSPEREIAALSRRIEEILFEESDDGTSDAK